MKFGHFVPLSNDTFSEDRTKHMKTTNVLCIKNTHRTGKNNLFR